MQNMDVKRALLGDHEAAKRLTEAGVLVPCGHCKGKAVLVEGKVRALKKNEMARAAEEQSGVGNGTPTYDQMAGMNDQLSDISGSVKGIEKTVSMSDEDIKALVDVAERRYVNQVNLTSQTPVITVNGANTGRTAQDRRALADAIEQILREEWASGSVRSTAYA